MDLFEKATRLKLRFDTSRGALVVEDLWELSLQAERGLSLDQIAIDLHRQLKDSATISFVDNPPRANEVLQLKFDIVKHIIDVRKAEAAAAASERQRAATKQRILEIIAKKRDGELESKSVEELEQQLAAL